MNFIESLNSIKAFKMVHIKKISCKKERKMCFFLPSWSTGSIIHREEPHFLVKSSMESDCLAPSSTSYMDLGKVLMLFVSVSPSEKNIVIVPSLKVYYDI